MREPQTLFGKRLREARLRANISQKQLGLKIKLDAGVASARMNQYEVGSHTPKFSTAVSIASALGIPTSYFFEDDQEIAKLIFEFSELNSKERRSVINFIQSDIQHADNSE